MKPHWKLICHLCPTWPSYTPWGKITVAKCRESDSSAANGCTVLSFQPLSLVRVNQVMGPWSGFCNNLFCHSASPTSPLPYSAPASPTTSGTLAVSYLRAFALAIPSAWHVPGAQSLTSFRSLLKCHLLSTAFLLKSKTPLVLNTSALSSLSYIFHTI